jgi:WD40 repeat protein/TPR repeat protein
MMLLKQRLRIFVSSPGDVKAEREIAALTIERLAQDYARFYQIEPYLWEYEAMVASGHFQDSIEPPSAFDIVVLILWSRLGTLLPERTTVREYRGIDGRTPITGTEWEFEEALYATQSRGVPDLLIYRSLKPAAFEIRDSVVRGAQLQQLNSLEKFWARHFVDKGIFLGAYTTFDTDAQFAALLEQHLRKLIEKRSATGGPNLNQPTARVWMQAPFRGLESYEFEHAPVFFGQDEALTKAMVQLAANANAGSPFLLVLGASGSGKSSLVKAGIVPKLFVPRRIPGTAFLRRVFFRPSDALEGEDLFDALARKLTADTGPAEGLPELIGQGQSISSLAAHLRQSTAQPGYPIATVLGQLTVTARREGAMLDYEAARLMLIVDQLEELFTNELLTPEDRQRFVGLLGGLVHSGQVWVIATMRKDFWHRADETPELVRMSDGAGRLELLPPKQSQLGQMIRRPAAAAGVDFEHHRNTEVPLNEVIAEEVTHEPGALPLLSYLLDQIYRADVLEANGSVLSFATYERLGRLEGAIATKAEAVLANCAEAERQTLGSVLFSLVQISAADGDIDRAVARRIPLSTFPAGTPQRRLVDALLHPDARLLVSDADAAGRPTVRVAHEALITRWAQAREYVLRNAQALKIRRRIEERYALWLGLERDGNGLDKAGTQQRVKATKWHGRFGQEAGLLSGIDLIDAQRLLQEHRADTEPHLVDFIERSEADERRRRSRSVRILTIVASLVTVLAIAASGAGLIALRKQHEAELQTQQTLDAQARSLSEAARGRLKDGDVAGAQDIILEVMTNRRSSEVRSASAVNVFEEARAADRQIAVLSGHKHLVYSATFSRDGRRIVTASWDKTARIWDAASGAQIAVLPGDGHEIYAAVLSPDGRRIVTVGADPTPRIWDAVSGSPLARLTGHSDVVLSAAFSPDGRRIITSSSDKSARIWDAASGVQLAVLSGHSDEVFSALYSLDGTRVITASTDKTVRIWDARSGAQLAAFDGGGGALYTAAFSPDGRRIVTASSDNSARIWDASTHAQLLLLSGHGGVVLRAAFSPDGRRIVTASADKTARIWDAVTGATLNTLAGHGGIVYDAQFSSDGRRIVTASADLTARVWDAMSPAQLSGHSGVVYGAAFSPDGGRVVTASYDKTARTWDAASGAPLKVLAGHIRIVYSAAFSPDGVHIVTAGGENSVRIWDGQAGTEIRQLLGHTDVVVSAVYSPDGHRILSASVDKTARIWNPETGMQLSMLSGHDASLYAAVYSPDGRRIATASGDRTARVWDAQSGAQLAILTGHRGTVYSASFSPDGRRVVTASSDNSARIWDAVSGAPLAILSGHGDALNYAAFSPDGTRIVTASADMTARIWDARTNEQLAVLSGHSAALYTAQYSPDGRRIVTASGDKTARIWDASIPADLDSQIAWSQAAQIEPLTDVERTRLGLPRDARIRAWRGDSSQCDKLTAAIYDPERTASGVQQEQIAAEAAETACREELSKSTNAPRLAFQLGRALAAKNDFKGARQQFETAIAHGYRAAYIDLANLLNTEIGTLDPSQAILLYEKAWAEGLPIAAYQLGNLFERGVRGAAGASVNEPRADTNKAWLWFQRGAAAGEPYALTRIALRHEANAMAENSLPRRNALLLKAFTAFAGAVDRAHSEDWPDEAWRDWRYQRATLARLLAREGMMQQVAQAYSALREKSAPSP